MATMKEVLFPKSRKLELQEFPLAQAWQAHGLFESSYTGKGLYRSEYLCRDSMSRGDNAAL